MATATPLATPNGLDFSGLQGMVQGAVIAQIPETTARFSITTALRLGHFLAQCGHEDASFTALKENHNHSSDDLLKAFPQYFDADSAAQYRRLPKKIGPQLYANRMGDGNEASGAGYALLGSGYIQQTGKQNYPQRVNGGSNGPANRLACFKEYCGVPQ